MAVCAGRTASRSAHFPIQHASCCGCSFSYLYVVRMLDTDLWPGLWAIAFFGQLFPSFFKIVSLAAGATRPVSGA